MIYSQTRETVAGVKLIPWVSCNDHTVAIKVKYIRCSFVHGTETRRFRETQDNLFFYYAGWIYGKIFTVSASLEKDLASLGTKQTHFDGKCETREHQSFKNLPGKCLVAFSWTFRVNQTGEIHIWTLIQCLTLKFTRR